jgi:hypothetical protein
MGAIPGSREPSPSVSALSGFDPERIEPYENTLGVGELRRELRECWDREAAFTRDLKNLPEVPSVETMFLLSSAAMNSGHGRWLWYIGKELQRRWREMQREKGIDAFDLGWGGVPMKCEYEYAAGLWTLIRTAIAMETRRAETGNTDSVAKP